MYGISPNSDGTSFFGGYSRKFFLFFFSRRWTNGGRGLLVRRSINRLLLCVFPVQASHYLPVHFGPHFLMTLRPHPRFHLHRGGGHSRPVVVLSTLCQRLL